LAIADRLIAAKKARNGHVPVKRKPALTDAQALALRVVAARADPELQALVDAAGAPFELDEGPSRRRRRAKFTVRPQEQIVSERFGRAPPARGVGICRGSP
jgi:ParB-like chromosome segregation protein Spo0J